MGRIINNTDRTFTSNEQDVIRKAMANVGVGEATTSVHPNDGGNRTLFSLFDTDGNYLFSIDTDADGDCAIFE